MLKKEKNAYQNKRSIIRNKVVFFFLKKNKKNVFK